MKVWRRLNLNTQHATDIGMEQAQVRTGINQRDHIFMSGAVDETHDDIRSSKGLLRVLVVRNIRVSKSHANGIRAASNEGTLNRIVS